MKLKVEMLGRERAKMEAVMKAIRSSMELPFENREQLPMEMDIDFSGTDLHSVSQGRYHIFDWLSSYTLSFCMERFNPLLSTVFLLESVGYPNCFNL